MPKVDGGARVFVSYSYDSDDHKNWVRQLATDLRSSFGIDVNLDQWDVQPGLDLPSFMENSIAEADRVIVVCSRNYVNKSNRGKGGVGYEKMIVTAELFQDLSTTKFLPIIRNGSSRNRLPRCLGTRYYIDFSTDSDYANRLDELARALSDVPLLVKPALGNNPFKAGKPGALPVPAGSTAGRVSANTEKVVQLVSQELDTKTSAKSSFSAHDITLSLRNQYNYLELPHETVKNIVHEYMQRPVSSGAYLKKNSGDGNVDFVVYAPVLASGTKTTFGPVSGMYRVVRGGVRREFMRIQVDGNVMKVFSPEWEGTGSLDGNQYKGTFKYHKRNLTGEHVMTWTGSRFHGQIVLPGNKVLRDLNWVIE